MTSGLAKRSHRAGAGLCHRSIVARNTQLCRSRTLSSSRRCSDEFVAIGSEDDAVDQRIDGHISDAEQISRAGVFAAREPQ